MLRCIVAACVVAAMSVSASAQDRLTVLLDWFINPDHAPLYIAQARGEFKSRNLEVNFVAPADPAAPPRLVATGNGDIAITYQPNLYQQAEAKLPVSRIGTLVSSPLNTVVALSDGPIQSLSDLKGKTVGYSVGGFEEAILAAMLKTVDLSLDDVRLVNINFALTPALLSGRVDAVVGAFRNFELTQIKLEGREGRAFFPEEHGVPMYEELIFIAKNDRLGEAAFSRFLDAVGAAAQWQADNPEEAKALFFTTLPDIDNELNQQAFVDTLPKFALDPRPLDVAVYDRFATFMTDAGLVKDLPPLQTYATELPEPK